jgi:hypothetical protein
MSMAGFGAMRLKLIVICHENNIFDSSMVGTDETWNATPPHIQKQIAITYYKNLFFSGNLLHGLAPEGSDNSRPQVVPASDMTF